MSIGKIIRKKKWNKSNSKDNPMRLEERRRKSEKEQKIFRYDY